MADTGTPVPDALIEDATKRSHNRAWSLFLATGLWGLYALVLFVAGQKMAWPELVIAIGPHWEDWEYGYAVSTGLVYGGLVGLPIVLGLVAWGYRQGGVSWWALRALGVLLTGLGVTGAIGFLNQGYRHAWIAVVFALITTSAFWALTVLFTRVRGWVAGLVTAGLLGVSIGGGFLAFGLLAIKKTEYVKDGYIQALNVDIENGKAFTAKYGGVFTVKGTEHSLRDFPSTFDNGNKIMATGFGAWPGYRATLVITYPDNGGFTDFCAAEDYVCREVGPGVLVADTPGVDRGFRVILPANTERANIHIQPVPDAGTPALTNAEEDALALELAAAVVPYDYDGITGEDIWNAMERD